MPSSVLIQATVISVVFYGASLVVAVLVCRLALGRRARRGTGWIALGGLLFAVSPWLVDRWLSEPDPEWARGPAPTSELRTLVWSDPLVGVAVSIQQLRQGGVTINRETRWRSPARTVVAFLAIAGGVVALGTFPGGPRFRLARGSGLDVRVGTRETRETPSDAG